MNEEFTASNETTCSKQHNHIKITQRTNTNSTIDCVAKPSCIGSHSINALMSGGNKTLTHT